MFDMGRSQPPQSNTSANADDEVAPESAPADSEPDFVFLDDLNFNNLPAPVETDSFVFLEDMDVDRRAPRAPIIEETLADSSADTPLFSGDFTLSFDSMGGQEQEAKRGSSLRERLAAIPTRSFYIATLLAGILLLGIIAIFAPGDKTPLLVLAPAAALVLGFVSIGNISTYNKRMPPRMWIRLALAIAILICAGTLAVGLTLSLLLIPLLVGVAGHFRHPRLVLLLGMGMLAVMGLLYVITGTYDPNIAPYVTAFVRVATVDATVLALAGFAGMYRTQIQLLEEEKRTKDSEMAVAQEIQISLMPPAEQRSGPWIVAARSIAARDVGGDFYEYIPYLDRNLGGVAIGDVAGKGIPAAMQMAVVRTVFRIEARRRIFPGETLMSVNVALQAERSFGMVTLLYAFVDPTSSILYVANAGHNYPILLNAEGPGSLSELKLPGLPLGIDDEIEYDEKSMVVPPGTSLVLYTDGIIEAMNDKEEMFGDERLREAIREHVDASPAALVEHIIAAVQKFTAGAPQSDDLTVVVLSRDAEER